MMDDCIETLNMLKHDLEGILGVEVPITIITDSKSLYIIMVNKTTTTEKGLMIVVRAAKEAFQNWKISNMDRIQRAKSAADGIYGKKICNALEQILDAGILQTNV